ncbi:MAG: hypothetical protein ACOZAN_03575 [Patescibacteria group bacterium]
MQEINFVSKRRRALTKIEKKDHKLNDIAMVFFSICLGIFIVLMVIRAFFAFQLNKTAQKQKEIRQTIAQGEDVEVAFLIFANKLKAIEEIFSNRSDKQRAIDFFSTLFGSDVFIGAMNFKEGAEVLSLQYNSKNIFSLEEIFTILESEQVQNTFSSVNKSNLSRKDDGEYSFTITVALKKEGQPLATSSALIKK